MIRIYLLALVMCATALHAYAQPPLGFGLKAGPNFSSLNFDDSDVNYDARTGFHAGFFLRVRMDRIGVQPELLLFTQGGEIHNSIFGTASEDFTYLSVPIIFKFYPIADLNVQLGPQFGFLLDGEREYDTVIGRGSVDITEEYKRSDIAVAVGAGYDFQFGLNLDLRYNIGVKDINDAADGEKARSQVFLISVGWNFLR